MAKKKKMRSFSKRLTRWITLTQLVVMGLAAYFIYTLAYDFVVMEESDLYQSYVSNNCAKVERVLTDVATAAHNHVPEIEESLKQPDRMAVIMKRIVAQNPLISSCGVSFVANYYPQRGHWFCPYAERGDSGQVASQMIGDARRDYLKARWFLDALKADSAHWSKPFFEHDDTLRPQVSYLVPIHDRQGRTVAILGADLPLSALNGGTAEMRNDTLVVDYTKGGDDARQGSVSLSGRKWRMVSIDFIIDGEGRYITHADSSYPLRKNYFELATLTPDSLDDHLGRQMVSGMKGPYSDSEGMPVPLPFFDIEDMSSYVFFQHLKDTGWTVVQVVPRLMIDGVAVGMGVAMLLLISVGLMVTRFARRIIIKRVTGPLCKLAESANEVAKGNFNAPLPTIKHNDEIKLLRDSFDDMQHSLTRYVRELESTTALKAAMENELRVAHDIQMSMLPKTFPPYPERGDIDIFGSLTPAKDVGGDLFDFYIRDNQLYFCVGDVSGKGVPASLVMAMTRSLFRNVSAHVSKPSVIAASLNEALAEGNDANMFVTLFTGILDLSNGHLLYCNAGHDSPLLVGSDAAYLPCDPNLPLGVIGGWEFTCQETTLRPEDMIFIYTHAQFGDERVEARLKELAAKGAVTPEAAVRHMTEAVAAFVGEAEQSDDLTMLAIKYIGDNGTQG